MKFTGVDVGFGDLASPEDFVRLSVKAEKYGFDCVWLQEGTSWSPLILAGLILNKTKSIEVGTGVVSVFKRHPEVLAIEVATLCVHSKNRFNLGIGSGAKLAERYGIDLPYLTGVREASEILHRLLGGESFTFNGTVFTYHEPRSLKVVPKKVPPFYFGALNSKMIELACELGDGLLISRRGGSSPKYVNHVLDAIRKSRGTGGGGRGTFSTRSFLETSIDTDRRKAYAKMREIFLGYTLPMIPKSVIDRTETNWSDVEPIIDAVRRKQGNPSSLIKDELISCLSMSGNPADCIEKLGDLRKKGLERPIFYIHGPDPEKALDLAGKEILPEIL